MSPLRLYDLALIVSFPVALAWWALGVGVFLNSAAGIGPQSVPEPYAESLILGTLVSMTILWSSWRFKTKVRVKISNGSMRLEEVKSGMNWSVTRVRSEYPTVVFVTRQGEDPRVEKRELRFGSDDVDRARLLLGEVFPEPTIHEAKYDAVTPWLRSGLLKEEERLTKHVFLPIYGATVGLVVIGILFRVHLLLYLVIALFILAPSLTAIQVKRIERRYSRQN